MTGTASAPAVVERSDGPRPRPARALTEIVREEVVGQRRAHSSVNGAMPWDLWIRCPRCQALLYAREYQIDLRVCSKCQHHGRLSPRERLAMMLDAGSFAELDEGMCSADPLHFNAGDQDYATKLDVAARKAGTREALVYGTGTIEGQRVVVAVHNFHFIGGSMGVAVGEKVARAINLAAAQDLPLVIVVASGGARQHEGVYALMQMAKTVAALHRFKARHLPYISILTDPTVGGVPASYGLLGDMNLAEPGAFIGFAGPRVIEQATKQTLPSNVNTAEFMLAHGTVDAVVPRGELRQTVATLLRLCTSRTYTPAIARGAPISAWENGSYD